ncbi:hydrogenase-3 nickel incorporation protein HypA [Breoghania corrubedonensis]|uniref:Hydrogenase maturation factor HypA n=2 Tax=Breoghania corrubedonensis TaxID=665038 RepID=A0A2T5V9S0_9HYPH|nr:hydrogenase maturation nickel metallochaperone HypA [Breoghania corrubedonensis]PTW60471.1 hydrogenase-3 nickel incorporation protein HypA [Breoghania corrubedonensis]
MHELTICESLFRILARERKARGFDRVHRLKLVIGRFSCLDPESLRYAFDVTSRQTFAEGALLEIEQPPGLSKCLDCGAQVEVESRLSACPQCGGYNLDPVGGDEMQLVELEVA